MRRKNVRVYVYLRDMAVLMCIFCGHVYIDEKLTCIQLGSRDVCVGWRGEAFTKRGVGIVFLCVRDARPSDFLVLGWRRSAFLQPVIIWDL